MSTPTSPDPHERPADAVPGEHAAPRPNPPGPAGYSAQPAARDVPLAPPSSTPAPDRDVAAGPRQYTAPVPGRDVPGDRPGDDRPGDARLGDDRRTEHLPVVADAPAVRDRRDVRSVEEREIPQRPKKPGAGRHLLGFLLGLVLTPVALLLTGIGTARLADVAGSGEPLTDALGVTLLIIGVLLLAVIVLLGAWSPAVPITGGLIWGIGVGLAFLIVPGVMEDTLESMSADDVVPGGIEQLAESAESGYLLVTGTLLVAAGIAAARARRRGRRFAERVAAADAAEQGARDGRRTA